MLPFGKLLASRKLVFKVKIGLVSISAGSAVTNAAGAASLNWTVPAGTAPGTYKIVASWDGKLSDGTLDPNTKAGNGSAVLTVQ